MSEKKSRRQFLKTAIVSASGLAAIFVNVKFDAKDGIKTGTPVVEVGLSEAHATCGIGMDCSGGGGSCGIGMNCGGGGAGGRGKCGIGMNCGGQ